LGRSSTKLSVDAPRAKPREMRRAALSAYRAVAAPGLQHATVDAGDDHLCQHQFRRADEVLHPHRQVLDVVVVALESERELPEAPGAKNG
jgi:hypothetical protein